MTKPKKKVEATSYDTTINVIGGLKDYSVIFKAIEACSDHNDSIEALVSTRNEFNLRTERSRSRIEHAVKKAFLTFKTPEHRSLIQDFFSSTAANPDRELVLFWQLAINNRLFREISSEVFIKIYASGRIGINKDDIIAWLKEFLTSNNTLNLKWSETTIETLATKYLNLMTKLNLLEGKRTKVFKHIRPSSEALVIFLYFAKLYAPHETNLFNNDFLPLSFVALEDIRDRLKKLSLKGFINITLTGAVLNLELVHDCKGISNALYL